jgi:hypothetical protein
MPDQLTQLLDAHQQKRSIEIETGESVPSLESLLGSAEVRLGKREKTWGETISDSFKVSLLNASKLVPSLWRQTARTQQERIRRGQFMYEAVGEARRIDDVPGWVESAAMVGATHVPRMIWPKALKDKYETYRKNNPLAVEVESSFADKVFNTPAEWATKQVDGIIERNPDILNEPHKDFKDLLMNPKKLADAAIQSIPVLAASGLLIKAGQSPLAFTLMYAAEGNEAYEQAIADGATEDQAAEAYNLYGLTAAAIEMVQVKQGLKLMGLQKNALLSQVARKASKEGFGSLTWAWFKTAIAESLEEMVQGQAGEWTAKAVYGKEQEGGFAGWVDRRAQEALVAFALSAALGPGSVALDVTGNYQQRADTDIQTNKAVINEIMETTGLTDADIVVPNSIGRRHRNIEQFVEETFGKKVQWFVPQTDKARAYNGWADPKNPNNIILNAQAGDALQAVVMHEITHQLKRDDPQAFETLWEITQNHLRANDYLMAEIAGRFEAMGLDITDPQLQEEVVAEVVGRLSANQQFLDEVAGANPTLVAKMGRMVSGAVKKATDMFKSREAQIAKTEETQWIDPFITDMKSLSGQMVEALRPYTQQYAQEQQIIAVEQQKAIEQEAIMTERPSLSPKGVRQYRSPAKRRAVKPTIHTMTGVKQPGKPVQTTDKQMLKYKLRAEERAAKTGYRQGIEDAKVKINQLRQQIKTKAELQNQFRQWVQLTLPMELRGRMLRALEVVKNEDTFATSIDKLLKEVDNMRRRSELGRLKKFLTSFKKRYGRRKPGISTPSAEFKMDPRLSETFSRILDSISTKRPLTEESMVDLQGLIEYARAEYDALVAQGDEYNPFLSNVVVPTLEHFQTLMQKQSVVRWDADTLRDFTDSLITMQAQYEFQRGEKAAENQRIWELDKFNIIGEVITNHKKPIKNDRRDVQNAESPYKQRFPWTAFFGRFNYNLSTLANIIGGMKYGVFYKRVAADIQAGRSLEKKTLFQAQDMFQEGIQKIGITVAELKQWSRMARQRRLKLPGKIEAWLSENAPDMLADHIAQPDLIEISIPLESGKTLTVDVAEALDIIMHTRNSFNYKQLLNSGVMFRDQPSVTYKLNANDIEKIWKALPEKAKAVKKLVDDIINFQQAAVNETSVSLLGYELANVDGYWHIKRASERAVAGKQMEFTKETIESRGHWKERVGGKQPFLIGDVFNNLVETVQVGAEYVGMAEVMRKASMISKDPDINKVIRQNGYEAYFNDIKTLLERVNQKRTDMQWYDRWYNKWTRNITRAVFGLNPRLAAQQYFSVFLGADHIGLKSLKHVRGVVDKTLLKRIEDWSPFLRERFTGMIGRELGEVAQVGSVMRFMTGREQLVNLPTFMVRYFDKMAVMDVWRMAEGTVAERPRYKGRSKAELLKDPDFKYDVVYLAEDAIRTTQPTWDVVDRSIMGSTRNPFAKAATMFHSQREKMVQMMGVANSRLMNQLEVIRKQNKLETLREAAMTPEGVKAVGRAAQTYGILLANTSLVKGWAVLYGIAVLKRDEEDALEEWATAVAADIPGMFYFGDVARDVIISWSRQARGKKTYQLGSMEYPPMRVLSSMRMAAYETGILTMMLTGMKDSTDTEIEEQFMTVLDKTWEAVNYAGGAPFAHATDIVKAWSEDD